MILDSEQSKNIVDRLRRELNPLKIILFGSQSARSLRGKTDDPNYRQNPLHFSI